MMTFILSVLASLIAAEVYMCLPGLARWIVQRHASKLPSGLAERMREEWLGEVAAIPAHIRKILYAVWLWRGIDELVQIHRDTEISGKDGVQPGPATRQATGGAPTVEIRAIEALSVNEGTEIDAFVGSMRCVDGAEVARFNRARLEAQTRAAISAAAICAANSALLLDLRRSQPLDWLPTYPALTAR